MVAVEWKEPPEEVVMSARDQLVALLKSNPGRWARVKRDLKSKTGTATWKKLGLDAVAAPAESDSTLWDIYARAPEKLAAETKDKPLAAAKLGPATPAPPKRRGQAPSALPAAEASPAVTAAPERLAEEDAVWEERAGRKDPAVVVPKAKPGVKPGTVVAEGDVEAQARVKAQLAYRMGHKRSATGVGGRRG